MRWIRVEWGQAVFEVGTEDGLVAEAPPIVKWAKGKPERVLADWLRQRGAVFSRPQASQPGKPPCSPDALFHCERCRGRHTIAETQKLREADWPCALKTVPL